MFHPPHPATTGWLTLDTGWVTDVQWDLSTSMVRLTRVKCVISMAKWKRYKMIDMMVVMISLWQFTLQVKYDMMFLFLIFNMFNYFIWTYYCYVWKYIKRTDVLKRLILCFKKGTEIDHICVWIYHAWAFYVEHGLGFGALAYLFESC
jgi:hypothetical protein